MKVLLNDGTIGEIEKAEEGQTVTVKLHDENGNFIEKEGVVIEILDY